MECGNAQKSVGRCSSAPPWKTECLPSVLGRIARLNVRDANKPFLRVLKENRASTQGFYWIYAALEEFHSDRLSFAILPVFLWAFICQILSKRLLFDVLSSFQRYHTGWFRPSLRESHLPTRLYRVIQAQSSRVNYSLSPKNRYHTGWFRRSPRESHLPTRLYRVI